MPNQNEANQYRRLIGDFEVGNFSDLDVITALNDATWELTSHNYSTPINQFDFMDVSFHNEIIWKAAINFWWSQVAMLQARLATTVGTASQDVTEKWHRSLQMVQECEQRYAEIQQLGITFNIGNSSRFSKQSLRRIGGVEEENTPTPAPFSGLQPFQGLNP